MVYDDQARYPNKNFLEVIDKELSNGSFDTLLIGGGSVDISNLDVTTEPEKNIQALSEKVITSAHKMFGIAEAVLCKFPSVRKVIIMKRTPRYDSIDKDPLSLKPQLSSLADSVSFSLWCDSTFKNKIVIGGQDIPNGDTEHNEVFGNPNDKTYDGVHMRGPAGKSFLTRSIQKVLKKAQLIDQHSEPYIHEGWRDSQTAPKTSLPHYEKQRSPHGWKKSEHYNPMGLMIERIRTVSSAAQNARNDCQDVSDDVFTKPRQSNRKTRASVIKTIPREESNLQKHYNVPVLNSFSHLLN